MSIEKLTEENHLAPWEDSINENREIYDLALEIQNAYKLNLDINEIKSVIRYLIEELGKTIEEIRAGKAKEELEYMLKVRIAKNESINEFNSRYIGKYEKQQDIPEIEGEPVKTPLDIHRKSLSKTALAIILVVAISVSNAAMIIDGVINKLQKNKELLDDFSSNLGIIASAQMENSSEKSILEQCKYIRGYNKGVPILATDIDAIADKIKIVALTNPQLFDVCLADIYFEMDHSRLNYMDKILNLLKTSFKDEPVLAELYDDIKDCDVFLDYLIKKGFISPNHNKYAEIIDAVTAYRNKRMKYVSDTLVFESLTDNQQKVIKNYLIKEYKKFKTKRIKELSELVFMVATDVEDKNVEDKNIEEGEVVGGRPSGS